MTLEEKIQSKCMKLSDYPIEELNELLDAVMFTRIWDEDYPEQENDPQKHLIKWETRLREICNRPFLNRCKPKKHEN